MIGRSRGPRRSRISTSARSFVRPVARLLEISASRPRNGTSISPTRCTLRLDHASSKVARGTPCAARACAPTTRNRVLARTRAASRSRKSGFTVRAPRPADDAHRDPLPRVGGEAPAGGGPGVDRERPHRCNAVLGRRFAAQVVAGLFAQSKHPDRPRSARAPSRLCGAWMRHRVRSYRSCRRVIDSPARCADTVAAADPAPAAIRCSRRRESGRQLTLRCAVAGRPVLPAVTSPHAGETALGDPVSENRRRRRNARSIGIAAHCRIRRLRLK